MRFLSKELEIYDGEEQGLSYIEPRLVDITKKIDIMNLERAYRQGDYLTKTFLVICAAYKNEEFLTIPKVIEIVSEKDIVNSKCFKKIMKSINFLEENNIVKYNANLKLISISDQKKAKLFLELIIDNGAPIEEILGFNIY